MLYWRQCYYYGEKYRRESSNKPRSIKWGNQNHNVDYIHVSIPASKVLEYKRKCDQIFQDLGVNVTEYAIWTGPQFFSMTIKTREDNCCSQLHQEAILRTAVDQTLILAQTMGGTMEYCHGVGLKLSHLLPREMGTGFGLSLGIKELIDPKGIMNPGKLFYVENQ